MSGGQLVSVIIPTYNSGPFVTETIDSVLCQTHPHREIIVVDDGSTDDTPARVRHYGSKISYIRQSNAGVGAARNIGIRAASGDYLAFLDSDDLWLPEKLEVQLAVAARYPDSGLIACDGEYFDGTTTLARHLLVGPTARRLRLRAGWHDYGKPLLPRATRKLRRHLLSGTNANSPERRRTDRITGNGVAGYWLAGSTIIKYALPDTYLMICIALSCALSR